MFSSQTQNPNNVNISAIGVLEDQYKHIMKTLQILLVCEIYSRRNWAEKGL